MSHQVTLMVVPEYERTDMLIGAAGPLPVPPDEVVAPSSFDQADAPELFSARTR
jgi:hypothetical protein